MFVSDKSAVSGFGLGVIGLLVVGIVLSQLATKRMSFSSTQIRVSEQIEQNKANISDRQTRLEKMQLRIEGEVKPREEALAKVSPLISRISEQRKTLAAKRQEISALEESIAQVAVDARTYRNTYRTQARQAAIGEKVTLTTRSGKTFQDATITEVSAQGMTLRHDTGLTRLRPVDLDSKWTERFQWSSEEAEPATASAGGVR